MSFDEHNLPCLYLLWPRYLLSESPCADMPAGYISRSYVDGDDVALRELFEAEGWKLTGKEWQDYKDRALPEGLFLIIDA